MDWTEFEHEIFAELKARYESIPDDLQKIDFLTGIRDAKSEMMNLNAGGNTDYSLPYMGEAYAIYYHMQRADNIFLALSKINESIEMPAIMKALDIGSGTGGGLTAISYWLQRCGNPLAQKEATVYGVEKAEPMSGIATSLGRRLQKRLQNKSMRLLSYPLSKTQTAIEQLDDEMFDLAIFSYTFDVYDLSKHGEVMSRVLRLTRKLNSNGVALFLVPNTSVKIEFMQKMVSFLEEMGMQSLPINIDRGCFCGSEKRPSILKDACLYLNTECKKLGLPKIYIIQDDFPYYGFFGQCFALTWRGSS
ncbi:MAG: class I SAM-dependent methyltransferase [Pyrinomonadaceae bacterium]